MEIKSRQQNIAEPEAGLFYRIESFLKKSIAEKIQKGNVFSVYSGMLLNFFVIKLASFFKGVIKKDIYVSGGDELLPGISLKSKKIVMNLLKKGIVKRVIKTERIYCDEPKVMQYKAEISNPKDFSDGFMSLTMGAGVDFEGEPALMKAIGEGLERFCLCVYKENCFIVSPYKKISGKAVNPLSFSGISPLLREVDNSLKISEDSPFRWVKMESLLEKRKKYVPAQLIYLGYKRLFKEPLIRQQISTGAAAAPSVEEAIYGGICELIERDAFTIMWLNKLSHPVIDQEKIDDSEIIDLLENFKKYNLEAYIVDITTDISVPSIMSVIIDRTGLGQAVVVTTKTDLSLKKAMIGAMLEGIQLRINFREVISSPFNTKQRMERLRSNPNRISSFNERCLFWSSPEMIEKISFMISGEKKIIDKEALNKNIGLSGREKLKIISEIIRKNEIDVYWTDITIPQIKEENIWVVKVVSPQLHPLYLDESVKHHWSERLFRVPEKIGRKNKRSEEAEINTRPHPFL